MSNKTKTYLFLFLILTLGLVLRLYKISIPLVDHHSWRQTDSAAVVRNLAFGNFNLLLPQWDNLTLTNAKGLPNPNRYFFEDFPASADIYPALAYKIFGSNIIILRLTSIIFSLLTILFLFFLIADISSLRVGIIAAFVYAILPFSIFFSRGYFQENPLNFYTVATLFCLNRFLQRKYFRYFFFSILFNILLFLTKPYGLVFLLPEVFLFWQKKGFKFLKDPFAIIYFLVSLSPFVLWWLWVRQFPEGIPYSGWLLNEGNIRFKGAFFYWIFAERIGKLILGYYGLIFFGLGLLILGPKQELVFYLWFLALLTYTSVMAKGSVTHDYYQIPYLPTVAFFCAKGIDFIYSFQKKIRDKAVSVLLISAITLFGLAFSWYDIRGFYDLKSGIDLAGDFVNKNLPSDVLIIAGDGADPTLLYNCNRQGWTVGFGSGLENLPETIETLRQKGAAYYVTTTVSQIKDTPFEKYMRSKYSVLQETNQYIVFNLKTKS